MAGGLYHQEGTPSKESQKRLGGEEKLRLTNHIKMLTPR
jgi:hypothetical protein